MMPEPSLAPGSDHATTTRSAGDSAGAPRGVPPLVRLLVALLIAAGIGFGAWYVSTRPGSEDNGLVLQGNVDVRQVNLAFKVDGRIASLLVDEGDHVETGRVLATLDPRYFEDELGLALAKRDNLKAVLERLEHGSRPEEIAEAKAQLAEREAALENARLNLKRSENLMRMGTVTKEEFDNAKASFDQAEARTRNLREAYKLVEIGPRREDIDAARAQLRAQEIEITKVERKIEDSRLVAPGAGTILTRSREAGSIVQPGETVFALTLSTPLFVRAYVSELDLVRIRPGASVRIATDGAPNRVHSGKVGFISPTAEFTPKTVETKEIRTRLVYRVRIVVEDPQGELRQGMPVTVRVPPETEGATADVR